jgi:hypothetical protein
VHRLTQSSGDPLRSMGQAGRLALGVGRCCAGLLLRRVHCIEPLVLLMSMMLSIVFRVCMVLVLSKPLPATAACSCRYWALALCSLCYATSLVLWAAYSNCSIVAVTTALDHHISNCSMHSHLGSSATCNLLVHNESACAQ